MISAMEIEIKGHIEKHPNNIERDILKKKKLLVNDNVSYYIIATNWEEKHFSHFITDHYLTVRGYALVSNCIKTGVMLYPVLKV